jgi:Asp-tRNA(Asn)/Glu-tRNA(Gln) amidotransferase A subunit family amidase
MALDTAPYELRALSAPRMSGAVLRRVFIPLVEAPRLGGPLRSYLMSTSGFAAFRETIPAAEVNASQRVRYPLHLPFPEGTLDRDSDESCAVFLSGLERLFLGISVAQNQQNPIHDGVRGLRGKVGPLPGRLDSVRVIHDGYRAGLFTPVDVVRDVLRRVDESNSGPQPLNAICRVDVDALMAEAQASTDRWKSGAPLSALDGIPVAIKDMLDVRNMPTTAGVGYLVSPLCSAAEEDSGVVAALRRVGALVSIKANMDELGIGVRGFNAHLGQVRNPLNRNRVAGGSSGGCAAAVAAGIVPVAIGTDGGGSVRIPAAHCGVLGLKPTFARVATHGRCQEGADAGPPATLHVGPIAACAADLALVYYTLAAFAPHKCLLTQLGTLDCQVPLSLPTSLSVFPSLTGVRIGVYEEWFQDAHHGLVACAREMLDKLVTVGGAVVIQVTVPRLESIRVAHAISIMSDAYEAQKASGVYGGGTAKKRKRMGLDARGKLAMVTEWNAEDVARSDVVRQRAMTDAVGVVFANADIMLTPALGAFPSYVPRNLTTGLVDVATDSQMMKFMLWGNFVGLPAVVFPCSTNAEVAGADGLVGSVQAIGGPWAEEILLRVALFAEHNAAQ